MQAFVGKQIDRYRILAQQGLGGMAVVYKAYDTRLDREVAVKVIRTDAIPAEQHERLMKRFEREAKAQAQFAHPNIIPVYDYGEVDGLPFLVMEYFPGGTLKEKLKKPIHYQQALRWLSPIADALSYAHQQGIIHRDVKPANILFDRLGRPILSDFGIAKVLETTESTLTGTGLGVGTPEYMAPEQWSGKTSEASDQYSLGVVLYETLTAHKPFTAETPVAVALKQMSEAIKRPSEWVPDIPEDVEKALFKAMALNPEDRYQDMAAFHKTLERLSVSLDITPPSQKPAKVQTTGTSLSKSPPVAVDSEGLTVDLLDHPPPSAPTQRNISEAASKAVPDKKGLPKWLLWTGLGLIILCLIGAGIAYLVFGTDILKNGDKSLSVSEIAATRRAESESDQDERTSSQESSTKAETEPSPSTEEPEISETVPQSTKTATPEPSLTNAPTQTSSVYLTPTPHAYTAISECASSQLHVGDSAFISYEGGTNFLRKNPDVGVDDNILDRIQPGEILEIIGGPQCSYGWILWEVRTTWDETGWSAESNGVEFWILPLATREICEDALPTRLIVGQRAKVMEEPSQANLLRSGPSHFDDTIDRIQPGHWMVLLEGPVCGEKTNWWRVQSEDTGIIGWTMEGDLDTYWLAPEP